MRVNFSWAIMALPLIEAATSTNARCGHQNNASPVGMTCLSSQWGNCCSQYGYCGSTSAYCGTGCQSSYGTCSKAASSSGSARLSTSSKSSSSSSPARTSSSAVPASTLKVSTNARCGALYNASPKGMTCLGSKYGDCCSRYSYCGDTSAYCGTGCQAGFGKCNIVPSPSASSSRVISSSSSSSRISSTSSSGSTSVSSATSKSSSFSSTFSSVSASTVSATSTSSSLSFTSTSSSVSSLGTSSSSDTSKSASTSSSSSLSSSSLSDSFTSTSLLPSTISSAISSTTSSTTVAPSSNPICGVEGYDTVDLQVFANSPLTTVAACLATCQQNAGCGSVILYTGTCYLARLPFTVERVAPVPGTGLIFYDRSCGSIPSPSPSPIPTTTPAPSAIPIPSPTTFSTSTSSICVPPAPTFSCVSYPVCPTFTTELTSSCPGAGGMCNKNYFVRCSQAPAVGSQVIAQVGLTVSGGDACRLACDARDNCAAFVYAASGPAGQICDLYATLNGFSSSFVDTFLRICPTTC